MGVCGLLEVELLCVLSLVLTYLLISLTNVRLRCAVDTVQKGIAVDPKAPPPSAGQNAETATLVASLREVIQSQAAEIEALQRKLKEVEVAASEVGFPLALHLPSLFSSFSLSLVLITVVLTKPLTRPKHSAPSSPPSKPNSPSRSRKCRGWRRSRRTCSCCLMN